MGIARFRDGDLEWQVLYLGNISRAGGKTNSGLHAFSIHDPVPLFDLLFRAQTFPSYGHLEAIKEIRVPWLIARAKRRGAPIPRRFEILSNIAFLFENMSISVDDWTVDHKHLLSCTRYNELKCFMSSKGRSLLW